MRITLIIGLLLPLPLMAQTQPRTQQQQSQEPKPVRFKDRSKTPYYSRTSQRCLDAVANVFSGSYAENDFDDEQIIPLQDQQLAYIKNGYIRIVTLKGDLSVNDDSCSLNSNYKTENFLVNLFRRRGLSLSAAQYKDPQAVSFFFRQLDACTEFFTALRPVRSEFTDKLKIPPPSRPATSSKPFNK